MPHETLGIFVNGVKALRTQVDVTTLAAAIGLPVFTFSTQESVVLVLVLRPWDEIYYLVIIGSWWQALLMVRHTSKNHHVRQEVLYVLGPQSSVGTLRVTTTNLYTRIMENLNKEL